MPKKKLDAYQGPLSPAQAAAGINAANKNARRLLEDARHLLEAGRLPSAASLAILSIEESGKVSILRALIVARDNEQRREDWRAYRSHTKKNMAWLLPQFLKQGARKLDEFAPLFAEDADHPFLLDQLKQLGFYTDCLGKAHWSIPQDVIDRSLAQMLVDIAELLCRDRQVSEKELELWVKHVGPVWNSNSAWMKQALTNWYQDMQAHGLAPEGENEMEQFIHSGLKN